MSTHWKRRPEPPSEEVEALRQALQVDKTIATLLVQRGINTFDHARRFFRPSADQLHDPFLMKDMDRAVDRIIRALNAGERILVYGDYDVDGTCSVALVDSYLRTQGDLSCIYVPDRYEEGYGLSRAGVEYARDNELGLIIALDCGTKDLESIAYAVELGIDVIVCDHHRPGNALPAAYAVLNPLRADCAYPFKELCGCGLGFKLVSALALKLGQQFEEICELLDLVALATAADLVPMCGENRALTQLGLALINRRPRPGLSCILPQAQQGNWTCEHLSFSAAPRINAAGRMGHASLAVYLLQSEGLTEARSLASEVEYLNARRKECQEDMLREALDAVEEKGGADACSTVVYAPHWHKGVVGIVASKLIEHYYRPTIVLCGEGEVVSGSARSVEGFDLHSALEDCREYFVRFGGHTAAAGMSLKRDRLEAFSLAFERSVRHAQPGISPRKVIEYDLELGLEDITDRFYRILKQFGPYGPGNPKPLFRISNLRDTGSSRVVGSDHSHLKLRLSDELGRQVSGIGFGLAHRWAGVRSDAFDVLASPVENRWKGRCSMELLVQDLGQSSAFSSRRDSPSNTAKVQ